MANQHGQSRNPASEPPAGNTTNFALLATNGYGARKGFLAPCDERTTDGELHRSGNNATTLRDPQMTNPAL
ncbi:UNVERIFIED_ORG: hypothetical protein ABIC54_005971 [Burkholderia sp. 1263]|nr:hypothetical protein [Paraburkholderia terricola]